MTAVPEWTERWTFVVSAVAALPHPEVPGKPDCMTRRIPAWRRTYRQLIPRRGGRGCCWYHGGDWHHVNTTAVRLLGQAHAVGATGKDAGELALDNAATEGITGWELEALASLLVVEPVQIELGGDPADRWYDNGRHRVMAMLDAGVRQTILLRWELLDPATGRPVTFPLV